MGLPRRSRGEGGCCRFLVEPAAPCPDQTMICGSAGLPGLKYQFPRTDPRALALLPKPAAGGQPGQCRRAPHSKPPVPPFGVLTPILGLPEPTGAARAEQFHQVFIWFPSARRKGGQSKRRHSHSRYFFCSFNSEHLLTIAVASSQSDWLTVNFWFT